MTNEGFRGKLTMAACKVSCGGMRRENLHAKDPKDTIKISGLELTAASLVGLQWEAEKSMQETWRWTSKGNGEHWSSSKEAEGSLISFSVVISCRLPLYWLVPPTPSVDLSSSVSQSSRHTQNYAKPISWEFLIQFDTISSHTD